MRYEKIEDVDPSRLTIEILMASSYLPKIRDNAIECRRCSSFLYVSAGRYIYSFEPDKILEAPAGSLLYLPAGAKYTYHVKSDPAAAAAGGDDAHCMQLEFHAFHNGEPVTFARTPLLLETPRDCPGLFELLTAAGSGSFAVSAGIFCLLGLMADSQKELTLSRRARTILPAVRYIDRNYAQPIRVGELASMCYLSASQLCRLFRSELGMSPIEYRTSVRIKVAEGMLRGSYESITSVAEACGYESIYAFSKAFRLATGMSPTEWSKAPELK